MRPARDFIFAAVAAALAGCASTKGPRILTTCEKFKEPRQWAFCLTAAQGSTNPDIIYYLHGGGAGEYGWAARRGYPELVRRRWQAMSFQPPVVATVSFGKEWLLTEENNSPDSGLLDEFGRAMNYIESRLGRVPRKRFLVGESMGAFNAAELALKRPSLFDRAALLCPGFSSLPPHASAAEFNAYLKSTGAKASRARKIESLMERFFPDRVSWAGAAPVVLAGAASGAQSPSLYVSCGRSDEFGFFTGAKAFADLAKSRGARVMWQPLDGGHCAVAPYAVADFLSTK
jgi:pimeloyl-ACP methyl ester carboxylesterase